MKPRWLNVDKATIFFKSDSINADSPAYREVNRLVTSIKYANEEEDKIDVFWIIRKSPAVTRVDEWTNDEIGVGAAIAAGSQGENGNNADFVDKAMKSKKGRREFRRLDSII